MEKTNIKKIKIELSKLPNQWHQLQTMRGGRVHKNKAKVIPRRKKYKNYEE
jgi:hypothetical protein